MTERTWCARCFGGLLLLASMAAAGAQAPEPVWSQSFERPVRFHTLVDTGVLIVGTGRHLYALDPVSGEVRWRERNVGAGPRDIYRVPDSPRLLVTDAAGGAFDDVDTHILALSVDDGLLLWESPRLEGKALQAVITDDASKAYVTVVRKAHGDDRGMLASPISGKGFGAGVYREPVLVALSLDDGQIGWRTPFGREVRLQPAAPRGEEERPFDLGNYHRPVVVDDMLCATYFGIRCLDRETGETRWARKFPVIEDDLALAYARPVAGRDVLYVTGDNRVHALECASGKRVWRSRKANVIPELYTSGDLLYAQLGGRFFHLGNERWVWKGEFGVLALNRDNGRTRWRFAGAKGSITNLHVEEDWIWFADKKHLYALDRRTGKRRVRTPHRMEHSPVFTVINGHGHRVLVSDDEVAAFDTHGNRLWSVHHPPPRPGVWQRASAQLFQISGQLLRVTSMAVSMTSGLIPSVPLGGVNIISGKSVVKSATRSAGNALAETGDRLTAAESRALLEDSYQYFLTSREGEERVYLAAVDVNSGETVGLTPLLGDRPDIVIDDEHGLLLEAAGQRLYALPIRRDALRRAGPKLLDIPGARARR